MTPRVLSIPAGAPFLRTLAEALLSGRLVPGFSHGGDPLKLAEATIYVPTRRAARELRSLFVELLGKTAAILPSIRPLGEFDEDAAFLDGESGEQALALAPPIGQIDRILLLSPLVQAWKRRLPAHVAALFGEEVVVPASLADAIWLSRDLAALMDEIETGGADWARLAGLVPEDLAGWWQVTLEFLEIVTRAWPALLAERDRSNPAAHRNAAILAEAERLSRSPPAGPVVAAAVILPARLPRLLRSELDDSKKLSAKMRETLYAAVTDCAIWAIGVAEVEEIDRINILRATFAAMGRAVAGLGVTVDCALVDGNQKPPLSCRCECLVGGDGLEPPTLSV